MKLFAGIGSVWTIIARHKLPILLKQRQRQREPQTPPDAWSAHTCLSEACMRARQEQLQQGPQGQAEGLDLPSLSAHPPLQLLVLAALGCDLWRHKMFSYA